ncbi:hypothetical protein D0T49_04950 [Paludibacter sp. 221]|uniref:Cbp1 family collagen-binding glycoprotein adhesin n=1 Tax=Paludibacter sp. 221 TaxID=2302939 RepID=UPI0013CF886B|nr:hypothetical protein [Paludibacter sp. 221]NDV46387.1 hypothetical protein [Paludibacter sp. 221]
MKSVFYTVAIVLLFASTSCVEKSQKYKALQSKNDSIMSVQEALAKDVREYQFVFSHIEKGIQKVESKEADHIQQIKTKLSNDENAKVNDNIAKLNSLLQAQKEELDQMKTQLNRTSYRAKELQRNVESLKNKLAEETMKVTVLQSEAQAKDSTIQVMESTLRNLTMELEATTSQLAAQAELVAKHEAELYTGYYIAGSKGDLKKADVLTKAGLCKTALFDKGVNKGVFTQVNILETQTIVLPASIKGKMLSSHPKASYKLEKQGDDKVIRIINPDEFWSVTKYLVIR